MQLRLARAGRHWQGDGRPPAGEQAPAVRRVRSQVSRRGVRCVGRGACAAQRVGLGSSARAQETWPWHPAGATHRQGRLPAACRETSPGCLYARGPALRCSGCRRGGTSAAVARACPAWWGRYTAAAAAAHRSWLPPRLRPVRPLCHRRCSGLPPGLCPTLLSRGATARAGGRTWLPESPEGLPESARLMTATGLAWGAGPVPGLHRLAPLAVRSPASAISGLTGCRQLAKFRLGPYHAAPASQSGKHPEPQIAGTTPLPAGKATRLGVRALRTRCSRHLARAVCPLPRGLGVAGAPRSAQPAWQRSLPPRPRRSCRRSCTSACWSSCGWQTPPRRCGQGQKHSRGSQRCDARLSGGAAAGRVPGGAPGPGAQVEQHAGLQQRTLCARARRRSPADAQDSQGYEAGAGCSASAAQGGLQTRTAQASAGSCDPLACVPAWFIQGALKLPLSGLSTCTQALDVCRHRRHGADVHAPLDAASLALSGLSEALWDTQEALEWQLVQEIVHQDSQRTCAPTQLLASPCTVRGRLCAPLLTSSLSLRPRLHRRAPPAPGARRPAFW